MSYSNTVQQAKASRSDHRKARAVAGSINRIALKRDSKKFKTLEREHAQDRSFGGSLKAVYFDSDGDGFKDTYGRLYRGGVVGKTGATVSATGPTFETPGISDLTALVRNPSSGPSGLLLSKPLPVSGPLGLTSSVSTPVSGPLGLASSVSAPVSGPIDLTSSVSAPVSGPLDLTAERVELNITFEASQDTIIATTPEAGTLKYAEDVGALFIYDGTDWHHFKGA